MIILGISDSHESHACILIDGKLVTAIAEERLSRIKTDSGYPYLSVEKVIKEAGIKKEEIDLVVFAGKKAGLFYTLTKPSALFSVDDWLLQNEMFWKPKLIEKKPLTHLDDFNLFRNKIKNLEKNPYFDLVEPNETGALHVSKPLATHVVARQQAPVVYEHAASTYVLDPAYLKSAKSLFEGRVLPFLMPSERCVDIDSEVDFKIVKFLMKEQTSDRQS